MGTKLSISSDNNEENSFLLLQIVEKGYQFLKYTPIFSTGFTKKLLSFVVIIWKFLILVTSYELTGIPRFQFLFA